MVNAVATSTNGATWLHCSYMYRMNLANVAYIFGTYITICVHCSIVNVMTFWVCESCLILRFKCPYEVICKRQMSSSLCLYFNAYRSFKHTHTHLHAHICRHGYTKTTWIHVHSMMFISLKHMSIMLIWFWPPQWNRRVFLSSVKRKAAPLYLIHAWRCTLNFNWIVSQAWNKKSNRNIGTV